MVTEHRRAWALKGVRFLTCKNNVDEKVSSYPWWGILCAKKKSCLECHHHVKGKRLRDLRRDGADKEQLAKAEAENGMVDLHPTIGFLTHGALSNDNRMASYIILFGVDYFVAVGACIVAWLENCECRRA